MVMEQHKHIYIVMFINMYTRVCLMKHTVFYDH